MGVLNEMSFYVLFVSAEASDFEKPGAGKPHAGIREGAAGQPAGLPRWPLEDPRHLTTRYLFDTILACHPKFVN